MLGKMLIAGVLTLAGDTAQWTVGDTVSGSGANEQVHILVKPHAANLSTNAIITSTKRTYYLDLKSFAETYMAAVSWRYPQELIKHFAERRGPVTQTATVRTADLIPKPEDMRFDYVIKGDNPMCCLLYTSPSPRDGLLSRMPSSA